MAHSGGRGWGGVRIAGWVLLAMAACALGGCWDRHEPSNPFIGPYGSADEGSFGALAPAQPAEARLAAREVPHD